MSIRWTSLLAALVWSLSILLTVTYICVAHPNGPTVDHPVHTQ